jgi:hypothetical protein
VFGGRRAVAPAVGFILAAGLTCAVPSSAADGAGPTLHARSTLHGQSVPSLVDGTWQQQHGRWALDLRAVSSPLGRTVVTSSWTTPVIRAGSHEVLFASAVATEHQGESAKGLADDERMRVCTAGHGCGIWLGFRSPEHPQAYTSAPGLIVEFGHGITLLSGKHPFRGYVQWRYRLLQRGSDEMTVKAQVATGKAAAALAKESHGGHSAHAS